MHSKVDVILSDRRGLTGVQPDPDSHLHSLRPQVTRNGSLALQAGGDGLGGVVEGKEERVPLGADLYPSMR